MKNSMKLWMLNEYCSKGWKAQALRMDYWMTCWISINDPMRYGLFPRYRGNQAKQKKKQKHNSRIPQANQILTKLNQELQRELEDKDRALQRESARAQKLDELYSEALEKKKQLEELLLRRNSMITKLFERLEVIIAVYPGSSTVSYLCWVL